MIMLILLALLAGTAFAERDEHPLEAAAAFTRYAPACAKMVLPGHSPSLPIPAKTKKGLIYRLMYYPNTSTGAPLDAIAYPPTVVAQFDAGDTDYSCSRAQGLSSKDFTQPLGPAVSAHVKAMSSDEYDKLLGEYYLLLDVIGPAFAAGKSDLPTRALGQRFRAVFDRISAPALRGSYLALSPKFWAWLRDIETKRVPVKEAAPQK